MSGDLAVTLAQIASTPDKEDNLRQIRESALEGARAGSRLVVAPEYAMYEQDGFDEGFVAAAEPLDGPFTRGIRAIAREAGVVVVAGMIEEIRGEDRAYNTLFVAGADGDYLTHYRKIHLFDAFGVRESDHIAPSDDPAPTVFELDEVTVGLMTCYDVRFPEIARDLVDHGSELLLAPASWVPGPLKEDHWRSLVRARAIENTVYVAAPCQAPPRSIGQSLFVDPMGVVIGGLAEAPGTATCLVSRERIKDARRRVPALSNRRYAVSRLG